ncbi:radical SAM/SPASM domain-containing protein [Staphylococcus delphini]|uniref:Radical SAM protein n=1 Tax=Staphylococcus delphini TaxID=53344 RepID=A0AAQ0IG88_9STAP|nr:radical SAM protein [Staphylococcus delphini]PCF85758.1 radical SAM/SPASM domain-containing protein [Staphylococcus delphini]QUM66884.1 radical SAM protein [Staphylococcus delphini]QUM69326.1 radical SAM protein [Staphylococcus delphini]
MQRYIKFNEHVRLHQLPEGGVIEMSFRDSKFDMLEFEYLDLNSSAFEACTYFDGSKKIIDIIQGMCLKYDCELKDHINWYSDLIKKLYSKKLVTLTQNSNSGSINLTGSKEHITPLHTTFEITHKCNLECKHCYLESSPSVKDTLSFDEFKKIADEMYNNGVLTCEITGGETFVHQHAKEIIEYALNKFHKVGILTNATILRQDVLDLLTKYKDKIIVGISLDSVNPESHNEFRQHPRAHQLTCKNIKRLADRGIFVRVGMSIYEDNMWEIKDMAKLVRELGAQAFAYNWIDDFGRGKSIDEMKLNKQNDISFKEFEVNVLKENKDIIPLISINENKANNCGAGWRSIVMDPNGNIRPCALFPKEFKIGNLKDSSYEEVFSSDIVNKLWKLQSPQSSSLCSKECPFSDYCTGCYLKGLNTNKNHRKDKCSWIKEQKLEPLMENI